MGPELIAQWERFIWSHLKCIAIYWEPLANKYVHSYVHFSIYWNVLKLWHNTHEKFKFNIYLWKEISWLQTATIPPLNWEIINYDRFTPDWGPRYS